MCHIAFKHACDKIRQNFASFVGKPADKSNDHALVRQVYYSCVPNYFFVGEIIKLELGEEANYLYPCQNYSRSNFVIHMKYLLTHAQSTTMYFSFLTP